MINDGGGRYNKNWRFISDSSSTLYLQWNRDIYVE
jgi:hypothetical protein